ncbi:hypothetical protein, partial [Bradyrhizobium elkanii]
HDPNPSPKENQYRIVGAEQLMSSHSSHPLGSGKIRLIGSAGALRLAFRIDAQYDLRYHSPVCALCVHFQHAHVGDGVLPVIRRQGLIARGDIPWRSLHRMQLRFITN